METVAPGKPVPDFSLPSTSGSSFRLSDCRGHFVVLYFYPKDHTPGCTLQGRAFRDSFASFQALNARVFGVSRDNLASHEKFKSGQQFPFELLADPQEEACHLFAVLKMKNRYGRQVRGIERSAFVIGPDGLLLKAWRKLRGTAHVDEIIQCLKLHSGAN